jgi:catechol 2,3-dioxygenase-like lactoylglutathione lyase family enzyme
MALRLDHANLAVRDVDETIRFLQTALPEFGIRGEGKTWTSARWVHLGTDEVYIALQQATAAAAEAWVPYEGKPGTNHLGFEVDDADALRARMRAAGYHDSSVPNAHPYRKRVYFRDREGNDWEFVQYLSGDPAQRNDYALPDMT